MHELASRRLGPEDKAVDELARLAAGGDEAAFDALVRRCYRQIYRWAVVRIGEPVRVPADGDEDDWIKVYQQAMDDLRDYCESYSW